MTRRGMAAADNIGAEPSEASTPVPAVRTAKSKLSVTLQPQDYYALVNLCAEETAREGARVTHQAVLQALVQELLANADIRSRVLSKVREGL